MANKKEPKYNKGDKFTIEIAEIHTHYDDNNKPYNVYRVKGFNSLFVDEYTLDTLNKVYEVGKPLNTKFVVTETDILNFLTKGKIYTVNNGKFKDDSGSSFPLGEALRSFEELERYFEPTSSSKYGGTTKIIEIID